MAHTSRPTVSVCLCVSLVSLVGETWQQGSTVSLPPSTFLQTVQTRGAAIIKARKLSSAMSAANAVCDHMRDWWFGTPEVGPGGGDEAEGAGGTWATVRSSCLHVICMYLCEVS